MYNIENLPKITEKSLKETLHKAIVIKSENSPFVYNDEWTVFYVIGEFQINVTLAVYRFCKTFDNKDKVKLIVSTYYIDRSDENQKYCFNEIQKILKDFPNHPEILLITETPSENDILFLYSFGDCFINLSTWGKYSNEATAAYYYKKKVISISENIDVFSKNVRDFILSQDTKFVPEIKFDLNVVVDDKNVNYKTDSSKIEVLSNNEFSGILYIGQYGTSGYATAAKGYLYEFFRRGIPISWIPLYFDDSKLSDECFYNVVVKSLINKKIEEYDTVIIHATADIWPELIEKHKKLVFGKKIIGYTVWETSIYPEKWVKAANESVQEIWCPSTYTQKILKSSGVIPPIKVVPHVFLQKELPYEKYVKLKDSGNNDIKLDDDCYIFYNISELNDRKGVAELVETFCQTFTKDDKVKLILKLHYKNYELKNKTYCEDIIKNILNKYENRPNIHYILDNLSDKQILGLHSIGNCYVSLCRSEGFGLPIFEAFNYGNSVIVTGHGGQVDYLGKNYSGLVNFELKPITDMKNWNAEYNGEWAYPDLKHCGELMLEKYKKHVIMVNN